MPKYVNYLSKYDIVKSHLDMLDKYYKYDRKVNKSRYILLGMLIALEGSQEE